MGVAARVVGSAEASGRGQSAAPADGSRGSSVALHVRVQPLVWAKVQSWGLLWSLSGGWQAAVMQLGPESLQSQGKP